MGKVRIGIVGFGIMAKGHSGYLSNGEVSDAEVLAVCDSRTEALDCAKKIFGKQLAVFETPEELFSSGMVDAVLIATPHYMHPPLAVSAFKHGLHVLIEKPAGVYTKQVLQMNDAAEKSGKIFAIMFNQRTRPLYKKLKDLLVSGELGGIKRINWTITNWYRAQSYYALDGWRATWAGEGGGVLLNQCPHQLDLWHWFFGLPERMRAFCSFGKYHHIEVEDDVTAYMEYKGGLSGVFIASTGEAPGSNRLEIAGDMGKLIVEDGKITFWRNRISEREFNKQYKGQFGSPECWKCDVPLVGKSEEHKEITKNWVQAILKSEPLIVPGQEGINSLELSNAMLLSTWQDDWVELPVNGELFYEELQKKINSSDLGSRKG